VRLWKGSEIDTYKDNPWRDFAKKQEPPYALDGDLPVIKDFEKRRAKGRTSKRPQKKLNLEVLPIPFQGNPEKAEVVILMLNPGDRRGYGESQALRRERLRSYTFKSRPPFVSMKPAFAYETRCYWHLRLAGLVNDTNIETVCERVMVVQYFPYWSVEGNVVHRLPASQPYAFHLVNEALDSDKLVVVMRAASKWQKAVPRLTKRKGVKVITKNPRHRSVNVSPGNLGRRYWDIVAALS
jgi:hypothetical protein